MLEDVIIIGIVMLVAELIKMALKPRLTEEALKQVTPLVVLGLAAAINVGAGYVFDPELAWRVTLKEGLVMGAIASGVYSQGKALLGKS